MLFLLQDGARKSQTPSTLSTRNTMTVYPRLGASRIAIVSNPFPSSSGERERNSSCAISYALVHICVCVCVYICVRMIPLKTSRAASHARTSCAYAFASRNSYIRSFKSFERSLSEKKKKKKKIGSTLSPQANWIYYVSV